MNRNIFIKRISGLRNNMLQVASRLLKNEEDAEDIVQEVFLKLWTIRDRLSDIENVEGYITQMTKNLSLDKLRLKRQTEDITGTNTSSQSLEKQLENRETVNLIGVIIDNLPTLQKMIIKMHDMEEYETEEIAKITGASVGAIRMNLSRARKKVRDVYLKHLNYEKR